MRRVHTTPEMGNLPTRDLWRLDGLDRESMHKVLFENDDDIRIKNKGLKVMKCQYDYGPDPIGHRRAYISRAVEGALEGQNEYGSALKGAVAVRDTFCEKPPSSQRTMPNSELELTGRSLVNRIIAVRNVDFAAQIAVLSVWVKEDPVDLYVSPPHLYLSGVWVAAKLDGFYVAEHPDNAGLDIAEFGPAPGLVVSGKSGQQKTIPFSPHSHELYMDRAQWEASRG